MSKNRRTQELLDSMDPDKMPPADSAVSNYETESLFDTDSPTVCVSELDCTITKDVQKQLTDETVRFLVTELKKKFSETIKKIEELLSQSDGWVKMQGDFLYFKPINALLPCASKIEFKSFGKAYYDRVKVPSALKIDKYDAVLLNYDELFQVLASNKCPYECDKSHSYFAAQKSQSDDGFKKICSYIKLNPIQSQILDAIFDSYQKSAHNMCLAGPFYLSGEKMKTLGEWDDRYSAFLYLFRLNKGYIPNVKTLTASKILILWAFYELTPEAFSDDDIFAYVCQYIRTHNDCIDIASEILLKEDVVTNMYLENPDSISSTIRLLWDSKYQKFEDIIRSHVVSSYLSCDDIRANIKPDYEEKYLTSPNRGHWDLWAENKENNLAELPRQPMPCEFYARNPKSDIQQGGVVGIDFGTKSTTVVRLIAKEKPKPMRIGHGNFSELPSNSSDYENPTVMQFIDGKSFLAAYKKRAGRPLTMWRDLTISHTASDTLHETTDSDSFPAFLSELKQWAGGNHKLRLKDKQGEVFILPPFGKLTNEDIDPIEIYAYYIGLNINHMRNGIFMRYEISYPVTYDKDILDRLRTSFERGIKKSLPESILHDKELMEQFRVRFGASEPAAYSLCALKEYGFDPKGDEKIFYGVFDFGGGTTDFDFGTFREASEEEQDAGKDYVLEHFRPSGDKYLGGENILQLIAYEVFKQNKEMLLKQNITFPKPFERENTSFEGEEGLIADSPEAHLNMKLVMEKLRPIWESSKNSGANKEAEGNSVNDLDNGILKVTLFDRAGEQQSNNSLNFNREELERKIRDRIKHGVVNFFARLKETFKEPYVPKNINKIYLFLAGNSCKSPLVKELFEECINAFVKENVDFQNVFELFPPLGSDEALQKMKERNPDCNVPTGIERPTGKTGVAFGLVMGRDGSNYLIVDKNMDSEGHIAFRFYVGRARKGKFKPILTMASERGHWERVMSVGSSGMVELQYSDLAEASTGELPEEKTFPINCPVKQPADQDKSLFIRVKTANEFEYVFAKDEASINEKTAKSIRLE